MASPPIHHINCGTMCPLGGSLMGTAKHFWNRANMVCHCLLIETDEGLVLIDTGMSTADLQEPSRLPKTFRFLSKPLSTSETALSHVERLGYRAKDVRHIFPTHLDLDHAGGLSDFPEATVHVCEREYEAAMAPVKKDRMRYLAEQWAHEPRWELHADSSGESWFGFSSVSPIAALSDELAIVPLAGHSAGHCGIAVRSGEQWILHAGDAFFHHTEIEAGGVVPLGIRMFRKQVARDGEMREVNTKRLQALHADHSEQVIVICSHDPDQLSAARARHCDPITEDLDS